ncbi:MAG: hypothetical protein NT030_00740 [Candidatus Saganbacteria bacterium]|nr:hypothetical protein [Candidatus Saganbacteria bacterium]
MMEKDKSVILYKNVELFLEDYKILSPEARATFEAELGSKIKGMDERTKKLYLALIKAAKEGMDRERAIEEMRKAG